jgi:hypothetical protein
MDTRLLKRYRLLLLIGISAIVRLMIASFTELGNDEVYYINYALYPDLSHFDHPPVVGWFIQLFSLNLLFGSELFIRLGAVAAASLNTWVMYLTGKELKDETTGWYAALLYTFSLYTFVISGIFIMPDGPQMLFWLLTLLLFVKALKAGPEGAGVSRLILLAGVSGGLALLSKYTSVFLFTGAGLYFLIYDRRWFRMWEVYVSMLIALAIFMPVIMWNIRYDFISFSFHSDRVEVVKTLLRPDLFAIELGGQIFYNNPFVFVLGIAAIIAFYRKRLPENREAVRILLTTALPVILLFLGFSLFRRTLPHWTGPAWTSLMPLAALYLRKETQKGRAEYWLPPLLKGAAGFMVVVLTLALLQIGQGWFLNKGINPETGKRLGIKDITLDMYGWKQLRQGFEPVYRKDMTSGTMQKDAVIIQQQWFPAANIDYYVARPLGLKVLTLAEIERTHKYAWITQARGGFKPGMDAYYFSSSYAFSDPNNLYSQYFRQIDGPDTIPVYRNNVLVMYHYVWRMKGLIQEPPGHLTGKDIYQRRDKEMVLRSE